MSVPLLEVKKEEWDSEITDESDSPEDDQETTGGKRRSKVWDHFDLLPPNKVRCLLCTQILSYTNNTSSMLRHVRAKHDVCQQQLVHNDNGHSSVSKKKMLDDAIVDMIIRDGQPFTVVEGEGFTNLMKISDPQYKLPSRESVKAMVEERYQKNRKTAAEDLKKASAVSLTADMWTSRNMDAYLGVSCHYLADSLDLTTVLLGVRYFPETPTAAHIAEATSNLMAEWEINDKVCAMVTDGARNIVESVNQLRIPHTHCFAHLLNLVVKKSISQTPQLDSMRRKACQIVAHFKSSRTAKEYLAVTQANMGMPLLGLVQEVEARWNSTFAMFQRLHEQREPLAAVLASLPTNLTSFSAEEYECISQCLKVLKPFNQATVELSEESWVSGSKMIPITKMLHHIITVECDQMNEGVGATLANHLKNNIKKKLGGFEKMTTLSKATILDPRFKQVAFCNPSDAQAAVEKLSQECVSLIETSDETPPQAAADASSVNLWALLDNHVVSQYQQKPASASATAEVQRYLKEQHLPRWEDPLKYWDSRKTHYPILHKLAKKYLCIPASTVPCERIFTKAGELVSQKRSQLKRTTVEKLLFLNKNL
ncbi:unnamed protein product [Knipowitschia caucasica]